MNKKIVSVLLSLCLVMLVAFAVPVTANAAESGVSGDWEYTHEAGMATITRYTGSDANVVVPAALDSYRVVAIGNDAFRGYTKLESVELPKTLTTIGTRAFSGCWQLTSITLPAKLTSLGACAFEECSYLAEVIVKSTSLEVPYSISYGRTPFKNAGVLVDEGMTVTFEEGCLSVPEYMFADDGSNLKTVNFSDTVAQIGVEAFSGCKELENVIFPDSLTYIGEKAFAGCAKFTTVTLPAKLVTLGEWAFANTGKLSEINVHCVSLNNIEATYNTYGQPFYAAGTSGNGITVTFAEGCTRVPVNMFRTPDGSVAPNVKKVVMADSVKEIGSEAFRACVHLENVQMGSGVTTIGQFAFYNCVKLNQLDLSNKVTSIGDSAFSLCSILPNVELPDALTFIGEYAFAECHAFTNVTLPAKLTTLGERAFQNCTGLTEIVIKSSNLSNIASTYDTYGQPFYGAGNSTDGVTVTFAEGCTRVPALLFRTPDDSTAPNVTKVIMADTVKEIGNEAFRACVHLESVDMGNGVTVVNQAAFYNCTKLKEVKLSENLTTIGESAFYRCSVLDNVTFPNTLTSIGNWAFAECNGFTSVTLPVKLSVLGQRAFHNCVNIREIRIKSQSMKDIASSYDTYGQPFYCAGSATNGIVVTFERGVRRIPGRIFDAYDGGSVAANIVEVNVAAGVREIGKYAFANCTALKKITFNGRACTFSSEGVFAGVEANAYHPGWPESARQNYGGDITWIGYELPIIRLGGTTRFDTAMKVADEMKDQLGIAKFESIIIASGMNFADALSGSYLASVRNAPILLSWNGNAALNYLNNQVAEYIKENLAADGTVYILGGTAAVPSSVENLLKGYNVVRLAGPDRFATNLAILREAGVGDKEILVCTGTNFADSLSGSATGLPILLVYNEGGQLFANQKEYLSQLDGNALCVVGGENAISVKLESALSAYGTTSRLAGSNRFETSVKVAEKYFDAPNSVVLAYAWNYPDGLCGGALAYSVGAPLILTMNNFESAAAEYTQSQDINTGFVLGSSELISDKTVRTIFSLRADHQITVK